MYNGGVWRYHSYKGVMWDGARIVFDDGNWRIQYRSTVYSNATEESSYIPFAEVKRLAEEGAEFLGDYDKAMFTLRVLEEE